MHVDVLEWVMQACGRDGMSMPSDVLEMGSRDWNGTPRQLFIGCNYVGVDLQDGPAVDIVADCCDLRAHFEDSRFDVVLCLEVLEHVDAEAKRLIIREMQRLLRRGGLGILTAGAPGRPEHDGGTEHYENVEPLWLVGQLRHLREWGVELGPNEAGTPDIRAWFRL